MANVKKRGMNTISSQVKTTKGSVAIKAKPERVEKKNTPAMIKRTTKTNVAYSDETVSLAQLVWSKVCPLPHDNIPPRISPNTVKKIFNDLVKALGSAPKSDIALLKSGGWTFSSLMGRCTIYSAIAGVRGIALILGPRPRETLEYETVTLENIWKLRTMPRPSQD